MLDNMPPADHAGTHGAAWACNRAAALARHRIKPQHDAVIGDWIVSAPGAHHAVHSCHVALLHLRPAHQHDLVEIKVPGATHELWVMAMDPRAPRGSIVQGHIMPVDHYYARVFGAQIVATGDDDALARIAATIALIVNGDLNPVDQPQWIELFGDAMFVNADA